MPGASDRRLLIRADRRYWVLVADKFSRRRVAVVKSGFVLGVCSVTLARVGSATPAEDTPNAGVAKAPIEQRLSDWAVKHHAKLSLTVASLLDARSIAEYDGASLRNPASVSKLLTAYGALRTLGPSHKYKTTLHGHLSAGHIPRLVIRGEGDPSLSSDVIQSMAARLSAIGLTSVDESIVVDQSYFDDRFVPPAFEQQPQEWATFRAPVCATAVDKNRLTLRILPQAVGSRAQVFVEPLGAAELSGQIRCIERDTKGTRINLSILPGAERPVVRIQGEVGAKESAMELERRTDDPRKMIGYVLRQALAARGISVTQAVSLGTVDGLSVLLTHESDALAILLHRLGKESDNFAAEMLLKGIGARVTGVGSSEAGAKVVSELLAKLGPVGEQLHYVNGSGLFDANRVSTNLLVRLLAEVHADGRIAPEYLSQLSIAGSDGTLAKRLRKLAPGCFVRAKTGTLRSTISLAGLIGRKDRNDLAFAVVVEDVKDQAATRAEIDRFIETLCNVPLSNSAK